MREAAHALPHPWFTRKVLMGLSTRDYLRSLATPGNAMAAVIVGVGAALLVYRFAFGLGAATNLSQTTPWGIWIGFDMLSGVALAAGGFTLATAVHIFGMREYHPIVRPAVLTGFLGYLFAVLGLMADLGRPWNLPVPMIWSFGTTSVMFEVAWCVALYSIVLFLECTPPLFEWLEWPRARAVALKLTVGLTVLGLVLSTLHQSSLGSLFLMVPTKLHPLWYSPFIPIFFFVSAISAGIGMVIVESALSHRAFRERVDHHADMDGLTLGLGRAGAVTLFTLFFLRLQGLADGGHWNLLATGWGAWFLVEVVGFIAVPCLAFAFAVRAGNVRLVRLTAGWTVAGVILNRLNVAVIAFNWNAAVRYVPTWMEVWTSVALITTGVLVFRWIVNRMPVLSELPEQELARVHSSPSTLTAAHAGHVR